MYGMEGLKGIGEQLRLIVVWFLAGIFTQKRALEGSSSSLLYCELLDSNLIKSVFISFQLLDFRQVLARLLGLDINTLSVPDYEIIARLERLVQAHHAHSITTHSLEGSLQDMQEGFRNGYDDAIAILRTPSPLKVSSS